MKAREYLEKLKSPAVLLCITAAALLCLGHVIGRTQRSAVISLPSEQISQPSAVAEHGKIDLNAATKEELMTLPGVGAKTADAILKYRADVGGIVTAEELTSIKGFGEKKLEAILPYITIGKP